MHSMMLAEDLPGINGKMDRTEKFPPGTWQLDEGGGAGVKRLGQA